MLDVSSHYSCNLENALIVYVIGRKMFMAASLELGGSDAPDIDADSTSLFILSATGQ